MDVDAPSFRAATLIGVLAGGLLAIVITATSMRMRHRTQQVEQLKHERDQLRARQSPEDDKNRE
ncbi:MAG: hypothetical protein WCB95_11085 [Aeromicrobium sp.]